jgi:hypothetical protein
MDRQARARNTVLDKIRVMTGMSQNYRGGWGGRSKEDKKQKTFAPLLQPFCIKRKRRNNLLSTPDRLDDVIHCQKNKLCRH